MFAAEQRDPGDAGRPTTKRVFSVSSYPTTNLPTSHRSIVRFFKLAFGVCLSVLKNSYWKVDKICKNIHECTINGQHLFIRLPAGQPACLPGCQLGCPCSRKHAYSIRGRQNKRSAAINNPCSVATTRKVKIAFYFSINMHWRCSSTGISSFIHLSISGQVRCECSGNKQMAAEPETEACF